VRGNQVRVKNADLRRSSFTAVTQKRKKKTQICVTRPQCVNNRFEKLENMEVKVILTIILIKNGTTLNNNQGNKTIANRKG
jgi:hypothetical protein